MGTPPPSPPSGRSWGTAKGSAAERRVRSGRAVMKMRTRVRVGDCVLDLWGDVGKLMRIKSVW
jgi:hypothetical protein